MACSYICLKINNCEAFTVEYELSRCKTIKNPNKLVKISPYSNSAREVWTASTCLESTCKKYTPCLDANTLDIHWIK